ncbi:WAT1-related protein At5g64700-like [Phragmites australis]|uniref:WAT1-related protein At5g64700-like n=1 Tax=Phragmites australis TaxID=29695 RepID=UPI002D79270C|nr:WAT1-related protein At5g64700-like [Phragmites australis]
MEVVNLRSAAGIAKVTGAALCLAGVFVIAFYTGPALSPVNRHRALATHATSGHVNSSSKATTWIEGTFVMVLANMALVPVHRLAGCSANFTVKSKHARINSSSYFDLDPIPTTLSVLMHDANLQAVLLEELPNRMLVAAALCVFSAAQSFVAATAAERDFSRWRLRPGVSLLAVVYAVIMIVLRSLFC